MRDWLGIQTNVIIGFGKGLLLTGRSRAHRSRGEGVDRLEGRCICCFDVLCLLFVGCLQYKRLSANRKQNRNAITCGEVKGLYVADEAKGSGEVVCLAIFPEVVGAN